MGQELRLGRMLQRTALAASLVVGPMAAAPAANAQTRARAEHTQTLTHLGGPDSYANHWNDLCTLENLETTGHLAVEGGLRAEGQAAFMEALNRECQKTNHEIVNITEQNGAVVPITLSFMMYRDMRHGGVRRVMRNVNLDTRGETGNAALNTPSVLIPFEFKVGNQTFHEVVAIPLACLNVSGLSEVITTNPLTAAPTPVVRAEAIPCPQPLRARAEGLERGSNVTIVYDAFENQMSNLPSVEHASNCPTPSLPENCNCGDIISRGLTQEVAAHLNRRMRVVASETLTVENNELVVDIPPTITLPDGRTIDLKEAIRRGEVLVSFSCPTKGGRGRGRNITLEANDWRPDGSVQLRFNGNEYIVIPAQPQSN